MTRIGWWFVDTVSQTLEPDERDAVRGDLAESGETSGQAIGDLLGLVVRRQAGLWNDWRPWLILAGLVIPLAILLNLGCRMMAAGSATPIWMYVNNRTMAYLESPGARSDLVDNAAAVFKQYLMLVCWSWASGFMLGFLSRRTIWVNAALFCLIVSFAEWWVDPVHRLPGHPEFSLLFYRVIFPLILQAVLILVPSAWGMKQGLGLAALPRRLRAMLSASAIATIAALAYQNWGWVLCTSGHLRACRIWALQVGFARQTGDPGRWPIPVLPLALAGPAAYIVAIAIRHRSKEMG